MILPTISIVIPTFNSEKTLKETIDSIRNQSFSQKKIEILIIDGGSSDNTKKIAKSYKCKIIQNPKVDLIYGKHIGFLRGKGKYLLYLDSDEILENPNSLKIKLLAFKINSKVRAVVPSGYKTPIDGSLINYYINEFGDPFSFFMYRESKSNEFLIKDFSKKYKKIYENENFIIYNFLSYKYLPLLEFWAGGCMIDLNFINATFPQIRKNPAILAQLFYLFNPQNTLIAITKNDPTIHYSSPNLYKYFKKIASRVKNNIYQTQMGEGGFIGREQYQPFLFVLRKYLFIPYSFSIILPLIDSVYLSVTRRRLIYLLHILLCIYAASLIIYYLSLSLIGVKPKIKNYGN